MRKDKLSKTNRVWMRECKCAIRVLDACSPLIGSVVVVGETQFTAENMAKFNKITNQIKLPDLLPSSGDYNLFR